MPKREEKEKKPIVDLEDSEELEALAEKVIDQYYKTALLPNLQGNTPKVKYFLKGNMQKFLGTCMRASTTWKLLSGYDYVITLQKAFWLGAPHEDREALLLHELKHIMYIAAVEDDEGEIKKAARWGLMKHDVEEFCDVVQAYGPWTPNVKAMMKSAALKRDAAFIKMHPAFTEPEKVKDPFDE